MTIKDIAKMAGVSFKTVSRVINNEKGVAEKTREKVLAVIEECEYEVNYNAKRLKEASLKQIAIVTNVKNSMIPYSKNMIIMGYIVEYLREAGYIGIPYDKLKKVKKNAYGKIDKGFYEGIIILNPKPDEDFSAINNLPICLSGLSDKYDYVGTNQFESSYIATKHLLDIGCKKISFLLDDEHSITTKEKVRGYEKALQEFGMDIDYNNIFYNFDTSDKVYNHIKNMKNNNSLSDGYLVNSDYCVFGMIRAVNELFIKVPEEIKFISFGDTFICNEVYPTVTAMKQNFKLIARNLVDIMLDKINNNATNMKVVIPAQISVRNSTIK